MNNVLLLIDEEYGYRHWYALITKKRYAELYENFCKMRPTLTCLVPITDVIHEAVQSPLIVYTLNGVKHFVLEHCALDDNHIAETDVTVRRAHIHEADDSWMESLEEEPA